MQSVLLTPNYCLTNFLPDRCSTGPAIPGVVSHASGDYRTTTLPSDRPVTGCSRNADIAQTGSHRHPLSHPTTSDLRRLDTPELLSVRIHSQSRVYRYVRAFTVPLFYTSGLSPYCCSTPNRTIHNQGSTWISLAIHRTQSPPHLCIDLHNTLYLLYKSSMRLSQDRSNN